MDFNLTMSPETKTFYYNSNLYKLEIILLSVFDGIFSEQIHGLQFVVAKMGSLVDVGSNKSPIQILSSVKDPTKNNRQSKVTLSNIMVS